MPPTFDRTTQDIGNLVELGHLNLRVPDQATALLFYVTALGLTRDPYLHTGPDNAWVNVGASQFHLPIGPAQVVDGRIDLVVPDLRSLVHRLTAVAPRLGNTRFAWHAKPAHVDVTCPWGNLVRAHAPDRGRFGPIQLGLVAVERHVAPGTTGGIARFYREVLGTPAHVSDGEEGPGVTVPAGLSGALRYCETRSAPQPYDGHHVQVTVADFSGVHRRLLERGLITEESDVSQYRFSDVVDPESGALLCRFEHEVRSMRHPLHARPLVNRDPAVSTRHPDVAREALAWRLPPAP